jgi:hypothetical protein
VHRGSALTCATASECCNILLESGLIERALDLCQPPLAVREMVHAQGDHQSWLELASERREDPLCQDTMVFFLSFLGAFKPEVLLRDL